MGTANAPSLFWYVARGSGITAYLLLTASVALGILLSRRWPGAGRALPRLVVDGAHRWLTLTFYLFVIIHVVALLFDPFTHFGLADLVVPFVSNYRPLWLSLGIVAAELGLAVGASVWVRRWIGYRAWHGLHLLTYLIFPLSLLHAIGTGSDTKTLWGALLYGGSTVLVMALLIWRTSALPGWRRVAVTASLVGGAALLIWSVGGPYAAGWAAAAGTPKTLLQTAASQRGSATTASQTSSGPAFPSSLNDTISGQLSGGSRRQLLLVGTGQGSTPLDVAIEITQSRFEFGGQVQLRTASHVPLCSGPVTGVQDQTIEATCAGYGHQLNLEITIDSLDQNGFSGELTATSTGPGV